MAKKSKSQKDSPSSTDTNDNPQEINRLKVLESYTRDVGRGIARIDYNTMDAINISTGDVIEVKGKKKSVAKALPLYPSDEGKEMIRLDGMGRSNAGAEIGETITIRKIKAVAAQKVIIEALEAIPPIDARYIADALESVPINKGGNILIPYFGGRLTFQVIQITPEAEGAVVTQKTNFEIREKIPSKNTQQQTMSAVEFLELLCSIAKEEEKTFEDARNNPQLVNYLIGKLMMKSKGMLNGPTAENFIQAIVGMQRK